ncbi:MAG: class GN sortase, partial [Alphaproteobacteria bacterium]
MTRRRILNGLVFVLVLLAAWQGGEGLYIHAKAWLAQALLEEAWAKARNGAVAPRPWPWADT